MGVAFDSGAWCCIATFLQCFVHRTEGVQLGCCSHCTRCVKSIEACFGRCASGPSFRVTKRVSGTTSSLRSSTPQNGVACSPSRPRSAAAPLDYWRGPEHFPDEKPNTEETDARGFCFQCAHTSRQDPRSPNSRPRNSCLVDSECRTPTVWILNLQWACIQHVEC